jgi:serine/threonine protein kinase
VIFRVVDMWSVGCVLGALLRQSPMFDGESSGSMMHSIVQKTGSPSVEENHQFCLESGLSPDVLRLHEPYVAARNLSHVSSALRLLSV